MNCCLSDICEKIGSGATPRGGKESYSESGISFIRSQNVLDWEFSPEGLAHISDVQADSLENVSVHDGDLLLNITGESVARICMVPSAVLPARTNQHVCILRVNPSIASPQYILAFLQAKKTTLLQIASSGATRQALTKSDLERIPIALPSLLEQERQARIIGKINELIRVNKETNDYLHDILLNSYRNKFFNSHALPNGTIEDLGEVVGGATPSKKNGSYYSDDGIAWITPRDLANSSNIFISHGEMDISAEGYSTCSTNLMPRGSVLFSSRAPVGYVAIASNDVCTNQGFKSLVPRDDVGTAYAYCFLKENASAIENAGSGTTFIEVSGKVMREFPVVVPDKDECRRFSQYAAPLFEMIENNEDEKRHLEKLRDTLLPKLLSGEIDVSKVDITQPNNHL